MRKFISSLFMLTILLLSLWSITAWVIGKNNEARLNSIISENVLNTDTFFNYELVDFLPSIFGATAKVSISVNPDNAISNVLDEHMDSQLFNIVINNGPILLSKSGASLGNSTWEISISDQNINNHVKYNADKSILKQSLTAYLLHNFDNIIEYQIPIKSTVSDLVVNGTYDLNKSINSGSIKSNKLTFNHNNYAINLDDINLRFIILNKNINETEVEENLYIKMENTGVHFKHKGMQSSLRLNASYNGEVAHINNTINSNNTIDITNIEQSHYPVDSGKYTFKVSDLHLHKIADLFDHLTQIHSFQEQTQWILEEQGEWPEGQDQIWQLQDRIRNSIKTLDRRIKEVMVNENDEDMAFSFSGINHYKGKQSKLDGYIDLIDEDSHIKNPNDLSLFKFTQVNAEVSLDNLLYDFIATHSPIKKKQFKLIYKQNKLLMQ